MSSGTKWHDVQKSSHVILFAAAVLFVRQHAEAATLYSQNFESAPVGQVANPTGVGLFPVTLNMGGPALKWEFTANGGAGGTKGLSISFDGTNRPIYFISFNAPQPTASDASPLGNGTVSDASQIRFSLDAKTIGNLSAKPLILTVTQVDPNYEADRGIDANMDGDMTDSATNFSSSFIPTLLQASDYNHVSFTLDQGQLSANITRFPPSPPGLPVTIPLTPEFDPTITLQWSILFGSDQFGSDAANVVSVDNIQVEAVPEPPTLALLLLGMLVVLPRRRAEVS